MGVAITERQTVRNPELVSIVRAHALSTAAHRQKLASGGFFDSSHTTTDIEQEVAVFNLDTGKPEPCSELFNGDAGFRVEPDTANNTIEYDASGPVSLDPDGVDYMRRTFLERTSILEEKVRGINPNAGLVHIGSHPFAQSGDWRKIVHADPTKTKRFEIMNTLTLRENPRKSIEIRLATTDGTYRDKASNLAAMAICTGTQIHIAERSVEEALQAHNAGVAIAGVMISLFGNSHFIAGEYTGLTSTRASLLMQGEQLRGGLPLPAYSLEEYYTNALYRAEPAFLTSGDASLDLNHGAIHTTSRLQVDMKGQTIRNEFRFLDSLDSNTAITALLITYGMVEYLKDGQLPAYEESQKNYIQGLHGIDNRMWWKGKILKGRELAVELLKKAEGELVKKGFVGNEISRIHELIEYTQSSRLPSDKVRQKVANMHQGQSFEPDIIKDVMKQSRAS